jgi:nucleoid-associated protein YgaU
MDGWQDLDHDLTEALLTLAVPFGASIALLVLGACSAELLGRAGRAPRIAATLDLVTPATCRRLAVALLSVSAALPATGAYAGETPVRDWLSHRTAPATPSTTATTTARAPAPAPTTRLGTAPPPAPAATPAPTPAPTPGVAGPGQPHEDPFARYVVQPGDCLWVIAAGLLPPSATNLAIDRGWRRIYEANAATIGPDPNLVFPGTVLRLPPFAT